MTAPKTYPDNINWNAKIPTKALYEVLDETAGKFPENTALEFMGQFTSYAELKNKVDRFATALKEQGVKKGSKVALYLPNSPEYVIAYYATLKVGGVVVNCSPLYSKDELAHQLKDSGATILITFNIKQLAKIASQLKLKKIIVAKFNKYLGFPIKLLFSLLKASGIKDALDFDSLIENSAPIKAGAKLDPKEDLALIQYTGGTTGTPKGAMLTHYNCYANAIQCGLWLGGQRADGDAKILAVLPFFHVFANTVVLNFPISRGFHILMHPKFEMKPVLKDITEKKPELMAGVPTMYNAINQCKDLDEYDLTSLEACISGGGPLNLAIKSAFEEKTGCTLVEGYGLTETSPVTNCNPLVGDNKEGSIGLPLPRTECKVDEETGELMIKGPQVMKGYYKNEKATKEVMEGAWLRTGDVAKIDKEGYVFIVDRIKEMIIRGGFKIYPRNVEEILYKHPELVEAAVVGKDDDHYGQIVKAFCVREAGSDVSAEDIIEYCKGKIGKHEVPSEVEFIKELPKTMIGKVEKKKLPKN